LVYVVLPNAREEQMAHSHANEYQIRTVYQDGTEEVTGWFGSEEQLAHAMATLRTAPDKAYWLQVRSVPCTDCFDKERRKGCGFAGASTASIS